MPSNPQQPTRDENEVLHRMLHTPPTPHKQKSAADKKAPAKKADK